jgi:hypothetical protein
MQNDSSLALCLFDFVPNLAFLAGTYFLFRITRLLGDRRSTSLVATGACLVFAGGMFKAGWKLMCTIGLPDVRVLSEAQFLLMAAGFLALFVGILPLVSSRQLQPEERAGTALLVMAVWKIPLLAIMTVCSVGTYSALGYLSLKSGARFPAVLFSLAVIALLVMSGMARMEQTIARQWIQEGVNSFGQISFAVGNYVLYRSCRCRSEEVQGA